MQWYVHMYGCLFMHVTTSKHIFFFISGTCFIQILMSVVREQMVAPKYVQIPMEVSFVNVTLGYQLDNDGVTCNGMQKT